jgi:hypothetical protein
LNWVWDWAACLAVHWAPSHLPSWFLSRHSSQFPSVAPLIVSTGMPSLLEPSLRLACLLSTSPTQCRICIWVLDWSIPDAGQSIEFSHISLFRYIDLIRILQLDSSCFWQSFSIILTTI